MEPTILQSDRGRAQPNAASSTVQSENDSTLQLARNVLTIEAREITALANRLDASFEHAVNLILHCQGRVVVSGMGKSGHIGGKIAATLASTGTPAFFMHPAEASHGDLGMITDGDVVIALSNSGESDELLNILPTIKRLGAKVISITGAPNSTLAKESDVHLSSEVAQEACPLGLSPTASTTAALALGDALAVCVLDLRDFTAEDFARSHPGGSIGRKLLTRVKDVMRIDAAIPSVAADVLLSAALLEMTNKGLGLTAVVNANFEPIGVFTDGDLRRHISDQIHLKTASSIMTKNPTCISSETFAKETLNLMKSKNITNIPIVDDNVITGIIHIHDLLKIGVS